MKRLCLLTFALIGFSTSFGALAEHAIASTYTDGKTTLAIDENSLDKNWSRSGHYMPAISGQDSGGLQVKSVSSDSAYTLYKGSFIDAFNQEASAGVCTGDISIRRSNRVTGKPITAEVIWLFTGGKFCRLVGRTVRSTMKEALPRSDKNGDFTASNAYTDLTETSGLGVWPKWQVVDRSGSLNCRVAPNGAVKRIYTRGQIILAETRGGNIFILAKDGSPWMQTGLSECYVRANKHYILPVSIPN